MTTHQIVNRFNLELANKFIHDNETTYAFEIDPNDPVFEMKIT